MTIETRIERLEASIRPKDIIHRVYVPFVADEVGQLEAQRLALERNPAPRGTKLIVYLIDYSGADVS
jgi:hypothetical protein